MADQCFSPTFLRASTAYGLSPRHPLRPRCKQPNRLGFHDRPGLSEERRTAVATARPCGRCRLAYRGGARSRREIVHNRAFNVGLTTTENYQMRELAEIVKSIVPDSRVEFAPDGKPGFALLSGSIALILHAACMDLSRNGRSGVGWSNYIKLSLLPD